MKKIVSLIFCVVFAAVIFTSCSSTYEGVFIKHNLMRDYAQPIVTINPISDSNKQSGGRKDDGKDWSYTSLPVTIYKSQLVSYINNYGGTYVNNYGMDYNEMVDFLLEQLIMTELVTIEADILFEKHEIFWTPEDIEDVQRSVYSTIDGYLNDIYNEILEKSGKDKLVTPDSSTESASTTYPVKPDETEETKREFVEGCTYGEGNTHDDWYLNGEWFTENANDTAWLPGNHGNLETKSLENEGVKRLINTLKGLTESLINLTEDEKKAIDKDVENLNDLVKTQGVAAAYKVMGKTTMVKKLFGDSAIISKKMEILQNYIESKVTVSDEEIVEKYNQLLDEQMLSYATESNYDTAASGTDLILYRPNNRYIYVKHILLPFSDEQKAYLERYKNNSTEKEYNAERKRLVNNIVVYPHVNGEDDKTKPLTVSQVWSEVKAKMSRASASPYEAERTFDDLIYKYNTDPGIFGSETGYAVKYKLRETETETYMQEFADAARAFRDDNYKIGQIYQDLVVTDYGVHIMYYASDYQGGDILTLNSYKTPGRYTSVREKIKSDLISTKTNQEFTKWQNERIYYYRNLYHNDLNGDKETVDLHKNAYKDLYQDVK